MEDSTALVPLPAPVSAALAPAAQRAQEYFRAAQAENTRRAYASDWKHFSAWCRTAGQGSLPAAPETVVLYLSTLAETAKVSTLTRRISAICQAHQAAGLETPTATSWSAN
jgi:site-specific recombinase XerD